MLILRNASLKEENGRLKMVGNVYNHPLFGNQGIKVITSPITRIYLAKKGHVLRINSYTEVYEVDMDSSEFDVKTLLGINFRKYRIEG